MVVASGQCQLHGGGGGWKHRGVNSLCWWWQRACKLEYACVCFPSDFGEHTYTQYHHQNCQVYSQVTNPLPGQVRTILHWDSSQGSPDQAAYIVQSMHTCLGCHDRQCWPACCMWTATATCTSSRTAACTVGVVVSYTSLPFSRSEPSAALHSASALALTFPARCCTLNWNGYKSKLHWIKRLLVSLRRSIAIWIIHL